MQLPAGYSRTLPAIVASATALTIYAVWLFADLSFDPMRGDVQAYWDRSMALWPPFDPWWPPGYPLVLAAARTVTFNALTPAALMLTVSTVAYLASVVAVVRICSVVGVREPLLPALVFAVYPFVGLSEAAYPRADMVATALLAGCVLAFERQQFRTLAGCAALALIVHKALWFFVPPLLVVAWLRHRDARVMLAAALLPAAIWIVGGAWHHRDALWFVRSSVEALVTPSGTLPVFDSIYGSLLADRPATVAKGVVVLAVTGLAMFAAARSYSLGFVGGTIIGAAIVATAAVLNSSEAWAVVRFSKMLVVPLALIWLTSARTLPHWSTVAWTLLIALCVASNAAFGAYLSSR
jgi:hypothetical protein